MIAISPKVAAAYMRMSTDRQDTSIDIQRDALGRMDGYNVIAWYQDQGISGDAASRKDFDRLIADAQDGPEWECILVYDQDRFSRFPPLKANHYWYLLDEAGIELVTHKDGPLDFATLQGWLAASIQQVSRHDYLTTLSHKVSPGLLRAAKDGRYTGGLIPYGLAVDENYHYVAGDPQHIEVVRRIFELFVRRDYGCYRIASELNDAGIPSPTGRKWGDTSVASILRQEKYVGDIRWGKHPSGKYNQIRGGQVVNVPRADRKNRPPCGRKYKPQSNSECVTVLGAHGAVIDRELWDAAQQKRAESRKPDQLRSHRSRKYPLSGIARCGCGRRLSGHSKTVGGKKYRYYKCRGAMAPGKTQCSCRVPADELEAIVREQLRAILFSPEARQRARDEWRKMLECQRKSGGQSIAALEKSLDKIQHDLEQAEKRLAAAPDDMVNVWYDRIREMRIKRDQTLADIGVAKQISGASASAIRQRLKEFDSGCDSLDAMVSSRNIAEQHEGLKRAIREVRVNMIPGRGRRRTRVREVEIDVRFDSNSVNTALRRIGLR